MKYVLYFSFIKDIGYKNHDVAFAFFILGYKLKKMYLMHGILMHI